MEKVGILYICTGRYKIFWDDFYCSINKFFLPDMEKHLFVWTDADEIFEEEKTNGCLHCFYQESEEWPFPTLNRFEYFLKKEEVLEQMDYLIFMNGNLRVNQIIHSRDILPNGNEELFVTLHPGFYASEPKKFAYENNPKSMAYIKKGKGKHYFAGGFNGGKADAYLKMVRCLADRIRQDLDKGIIAVWHDESHLNRFIYDCDEAKYRILSPAYLYPEGWDIPFEEIITVVDKSKKGGHTYLRRENEKSKGVHIVRFKGGFANQLFQLCLYKKLEHIYGRENVYADITHYRKNKDHGGFRLSKYYDLRYIAKLPKNYISVNEKNYKDITAQSKTEFCYDGYWQDEVFLPENTDFVKEFFDNLVLEDGDKKLLSMINAVQSVSVHVRRGDYVDNYFHGNIANRIYIENAIKYMLEKMDQPEFFLFSDDIGWCRDNISIDGAILHFVEGNDDRTELDLYLMSRCKHNIISNSSYSWWAQRLNENEDKIVISPEYWFNEVCEPDNLNSESFIHVRNVPDVVTPCDHPRFSILIPVFNSETTVRRCLESTLNQSYENIEIIAVDDASTDNSYQLLKDYAGHDARIRVIRKEKNESLLSSRIAAMKQARGEYILFLDSDDYLVSEACNCLDQEINKESADIIEFSYIREPIKIITRNSRPIENSKMEDVLNAVCSPTVWNKCYSFELISEVLKYAEDFYCNMSEDRYFTVLFLGCNKSYRRIDDILYHYVLASGMSTTKKMNKTSLSNAIVSMKNKNAYLERYIESKYPDKMELTKNYIQNEINYMIRMCKGLNQPLKERVSLMKLIEDEFGISCKLDIYKMIFRNKLGSLYRTFRKMIR